MRATQSNLSDAEFADSVRRQLFLTGGLFRRVDWGLQGGLVVDYLSQEWYSNIDLVQLRGEVSWVFPCTHELGFWFTTGTQDQTQESHITGVANGLAESWEPTHLFAFFYRHRLAAFPGAEARGYAGFSNDSDGLIGADVHLPFGTNWGLETGFTYLAPQESSGTAGHGHAHEAWNVAISLVWYPGCRDLCGPNYFRPLFGVADNGSFMVGEQ